jgi:hypothetical protein
MKLYKSIAAFLSAVLIMAASLLWRGYHWSRRSDRTPLWIRLLILRGAQALQPVCGAADQDNAQIGSQTEVYFWDELISSPPQYVALGKYRQLTDILGVELPEVNSTTLDSAEEEFIAGLGIGKEFSTVVTLTAASLANLEAINAAKQNIDIKVVIPAPTTQTRYFAATPRGFASGTTTPSGLQELTANFRRSGAASTIDPHV